MTILSKWQNKKASQPLIIAWSGTALLTMILMVQGIVLVHSLLFPPTPDNRLIKLDKSYQLPKVYLSQIKSQEFFGSKVQQVQYDEPEMLDEDSLFNAPEFKGKSRLVGMVVSSDPFRSLAIIDYNQRQQSYSIDEKIDENEAMLLHIFPDRIAIKSKGSYYTLRLPE
jgi:type II secretion system protein C